MSAQSGSTRPPRLPGGAPGGTDPHRARTPAPGGITDPAQEASTSALDALAWLLDDIVRIPGINLRIGLDALIGLVPGIGDSVGAALGSAILVGSVRHRVPVHVLARMGWNILFDVLLGLIPGVGDIADAAHRANRKNYVLLREVIENGQQVQAGTRGYLLRAGLFAAAMIAVLIAAAVFTVWMLAQGLHALVT